MSILEGLGDSGYVLALCFAAFGSALGTSAAGMAALGAWKKCFLQNRNVPFVLVAFVGAPLSQTIYGMILMNAIKGAPETVSPMAKLTIGLMGGLAMGLSSYRFRHLRKAHQSQ